MTAGARLAVIAALFGCASDSAGDGGSSTSNAESSSTSTSSESSSSSSESGVDASSSESSSSSSSTGDEPLPECPGYMDAIAAATIVDPAIVEASGLAASRAHPGVLWVHNDSGDGARVFAIYESGASLAELAIDDAIALDWEDMSLGPGPDEGVDYLYFGDIGDNPELRATVQVYRVAEPDPADGSGTVTGAVMLDLNYPDGSHNAETLLVDPKTGDIVIVTKEARGPSIVFVAPFPQEEGAPIDMQAIGELAFGSATLPGSELATGGDISPDGSTIAIRTYDSVFGWRRTPTMTLEEAFAGAPCPLPMMARTQGEALAFTTDAYYTVSEGAMPTLWRFDAI
ncbi:MAG TPA: hypothetical protein VG755_29560 [Nannocystaceae bacterium]|nr:hypothetical protein [Nannocystaceae bacterium]